MDGRSAKSAIVFLNTNNKADGNVYADMPKDFQGLFEGVPTPNYDPDAWRHIKYRDLTTWRDAGGWDKNSVLADVRIDFDPDSLQLTISGAKKLPQASVVNRIHHDMLGRTTATSRVAGPVENLETRGTVHVDPRLSS